MRISSPTLALALAACGGPQGDPPSGDLMACALDGADAFAEVCRVETTIVPGGSVLVVRHPEGGLRRFEVEGDLVRTADGADEAQSRVVAGSTEVTVGDDRYRFLPPAPPVDAERR